MPFPSKRKLSSAKNGFQKNHEFHPQKRAKVQSYTRNLDTNSNESTEREHEEPVILEKRLRDKTIKIDKLTANNDGNVMIIQNEFFNKTLQILCCPNCKSSNTLSQKPTSLSGLSTRYKISCSDCDFMSKTQHSCDDSKLEAAALSTRTLGIRPGQAERFLQMLSLCISYVPSKKAVKVEHETVNFKTDKFKKISKKQAAVIVEQITPEVVNEAKLEWIELAEQTKTPLECGADTAYCNTGRNSQGAITSIIGKFKDCYKIVEFHVCKRFQETKEGTKYLGDIYRNTSAQHLEALNMQKLISNFIIPLANMHPIKITTDQDCRMQKLLEEMTLNCLHRLQVLTDTAHLCKNIRSKLQKILALPEIRHSGDGNGKLGNYNFYRLTTTCRLKVKLLCKRRKTQGISKDEIRKEMKALKMHCLGIHTWCNEKGRNCGKEKILKIYKGKFELPKLQKLITEMFDKFLCSESFIDKIHNSGSTSMVEWFHSLLVNRRLVVKNDNIHVKSYYYDAACSVGACIYNLGEKQALTRIYKKFGFNLHQSVINKLEIREKEKGKRRLRNLNEKPVILQQRQKNQKQHQSETKFREQYVYRNVAEQFEYEQELSRNVTIRKRKKV